VHYVKVLIVDKEKPQQRGAEVFQGVELSTI
jgi:hypothetical protein